MTYPKAALASHHPINRATCFVMMPFRPEFDSIYHRIKETLRSPPLNIACSRADDIRQPNILDTILRAIAQSEYALADLTGLNPNVFYEVGVAHCTKDPEKVVLLTQNIDELPFDLRQLRCIGYRRSASGMRALKSELIRTFQHASADTIRLRLPEGQTHTLDKRLTGRSNDLFELSVECYSVGLDGAKFVIRYDRMSLDAAGAQPQPDKFYIGLNDAPRRLSQVPWEVHLADFNENGALLVLERVRSEAGA